MIPASVYLIRLLELVSYFMLASLFLCLSCILLHIYLTTDSIFCTYASHFGSNYITTAWCVCRTWCNRRRVQTRRYYGTTLNNGQHQQLHQHEVEPDACGHVGDVTAGGYLRGSVETRQTAHRVIRWPRPRRWRHRPHADDWRRLAVTWTGCRHRYRSDKAGHWHRYGPVFILGLSGGGIPPPPIFFQKSPEKKIQNELCQNWIPKHFRRDFLSSFWGLRPQTTTGALLLVPICLYCLNCTTFG